MKTIRTNIKGYAVELEIDSNEDPNAECWIEKGYYSGSLAMLGQTGYLLNSIDDELNVPDSIIHKIEDWAYANGY
jgi:hypothetical protein